MRVKVFNGLGPSEGHRDGPEEEGGGRAETAYRGGAREEDPPVADPEVVIVGSDVDRPRGQGRGRLGDLGVQRDVGVEPRCRSPLARKWRESAAASTPLKDQRP
jgi:hypothetical protein